MSIEWESVQFTVWKATICLNQQSSDICWFWCVNEILKAWSRVVPFVVLARNSKSLRMRSGSDHISSGLCSTSHKPLFKRDPHNISDSFFEQNLVFYCTASDWANYFSNNQWYMIKPRFVDNEISSEKRACKVHLLFGPWILSTPQSFVTSFTVTS